MLTIEQLQKMIEDNQKLINQELESRCNASRLVELMNHRSILKDTLIETLKNQLDVVQYRQLSQYGKVG